MRRDGSKGSLNGDQERYLEALRDLKKVDKRLKNSGRLTVDEIGKGMDES